MPRLKYLDPSDGQYKLLAVGGGGSGTTPPGVLAPFAGSSAPTGYLLCDGSAVSRTTYSALFAVCGTTYGVGNGSTTFNLPNLKGRIPVGLDAGQTEFDTVGEQGGSKTHTHQHVAPNTRQGSQIGTMDPGTAQLNAGGSTYAWSDNVLMNASAYTAVQEITSERWIVTSSASSSLPPYISMNYIIKT